MKPIEEIKSFFKGSVNNEGEDGFTASYWSQGIQYILQVSWGLNWEHASISVNSPKQRIPTWQEMCIFKEMIWRDDECVMQLHPPKSNYVNTCKYCLHLWRPIDKEIPQPSISFV
jgi:hypothetical protein